MAPSGNCREQSAVVVLGVPWESSGPSHRLTKARGSMQRYNVKGREGLAGARPANWLSWSQLSLRTGGQVPCGVGLLERPKAVAPCTMDGEENQTLLVGCCGNGRWEAPLASGAQLTPSSRCSAQGSTHSLQCPLRPLAKCPIRLGSHGF